MNVLGLSMFADSSAAVVREGRVVSAVEEERLNRIKHFEGMPRLATAECLDIAGMRLGDVDAVAIGWNLRRGWITRLGHTAKAALTEPNALAGKMDRGNGYLRGCRDILLLRHHLKRLFPDQRVPRITYVDHHVAHAASAFLCSPFDEADIMIADGIGEAASISFYRGAGTEIRRLHSICFPHSLGHAYASVTGFLGFRMTCDEGKVMALASYGEDRYRSLFRDLVRISEDGRRIHVDTGLLDYHAARQGVFPDVWLQRTGLGPRLAGEPLEARHRNLACSLQKRIEEAVVALLDAHFPMWPERNLCAAGGLFLNSVLNGILARKCGGRLFVQPATGDGGASLGAALAADALIDERFRRHEMMSASLGRAYSDDDVARAVAAVGGPAGSPSRKGTGSVFERTADLLAEGAIIGWFQGRMEFGPRALGNRSILAWPGFDWMKDTLNARVKHRESFRPFACAVLREDVAEYFAEAHDSPSMLKVFGLKPEYRSAFPAISHVDGSCRVQTVTRERAPELHELLLAVKRRTGHGIVLNTSMNDAGEPIVDTPSQALALLCTTDLDGVAVHDRVVMRSDVVRSEPVGEARAR